MTPAHTYSPLRRSEVGSILRQGNENVAINDDEEERREARRLTIQSVASDTNSTFEENETLKKCLEMYAGNKLCRENAWSLSLIDTLASLLERHHKSLNNFKVAGSSLEASSKVYSLRVDSIHIDVLRLSAGLNAKKFNEEDIVDDDDDSVATGGDGASAPAAEAAGPGDKKEKQATKKKRIRRPVATITKNKLTINAPLDTVPSQDPVFGKLNSVVGSINSSTRLMNNILLTKKSALCLNTNFKFWDSTVLEKCDYTEEVPIPEDIAANELVPCDNLLNILRNENVPIRPCYGGYVISDLPETKDEKEMLQDPVNNTLADDTGYQNDKVLSMAFDMNAECEPPPDMDPQPQFLDVDLGDFDDLTLEDRTAIHNCRGLRKAPVVIEDLRPIDASSKLEYSYRPLDNIGQFWAGPSHWKFKRARTRPSSLSQHLSTNVTDNNGRKTIGQRNKRVQSQMSLKKRSKLKFGEFHDNLFLKLDSKYKGRKVNFQKKWEQKKLRLPTDLQLENDMFDKFEYAPGLTVEEEQNAAIDSQESDMESQDLSSLPTSHPFDNHFAEDSQHGNYMNVSSFGENNNDSAKINVSSTHEIGGLSQIDMDHPANNTVLEIANEFEGAPQQVTKIIVPFARRAKVIDMKNLKRSCNLLLEKQLNTNKNSTDAPKHPIRNDESYTDGVASFNEIYKNLPKIVTPAMNDSMSTSIAFYSILHLANENNLRLIPQEDLEDFKIRKVNL